MSCYLAEVLSSVKKVEIEEINTKCPEVASEVDNCKTEVLSFLEDIYVRFLERPRKNKALATKVNKLQEDITGLITNVEHLTQKELTQAEKDFERHLESLNQVNITISLVSTVYEVHEALVDADRLFQDQSYLKCMERVLDTEQFLSRLEPNHNLPVLNEMTCNVITVKSSLLNRLSNVIRDNVILNPGDEKSVMKIRTESEVMDEVLSSLYRYKTCVPALDNVTRFLWNNVFVTVVDTTTDIKITEEDNFAILEVITVEPNKKSPYPEVFANITTILNFLSKRFNIDLSGDFTTLDYIGRDIRDNLSEIIIKHCLQETIPSTSEGLVQYEVVIKATEELEKTLVSSKIFAKDTTSIFEYANNIDVLFINKKCQGYIEAAQKLMKKDLHDLVEIGVEEQTASLESSDGFPRCCISRNVVELSDLLESMLTQAVESSEVCAGRLFCTVKNICRKYVTFVPEHHKKLLQTIPQQIALFYNNCMYISHKLSDWGTTKRLPSLLNIGPNGFGDEGRELRQIASEKFEAYVAAQIGQIDETMRGSGFRKATLESLDAGSEKAVRQCLRQQELLKTVWAKVLPYAVYNRTLGAVLDALCANLVDSVVRFEDISSDAAEQLVEMFRMVQTRGPKLFTDAKEVGLFVGAWYRMGEAAFVLNASLVDINDRWADGKGPLALQFKAEELRQLVRALFQNTERRAALLARIYD